MDCQYSGWTPAAGTPVPRVDISGITPREFFEKFVAKRKPCIISGCIPGSPFLQWDLPFIAGRAGSCPVKVEQRESDTDGFGRGRSMEMQFDQFAQHLIDKSNRFYMTTQPLPELSDGRPDLMAEPVTSLAGDIPLRPEIMGHLVPFTYNLWIGSTTSGSSSGLHHDFHDNLYVLIHGRKSFKLFSPADTENMYTRGHVEIVHPNGRICYTGKMTLADGSDPVLVGAEQEKAAAEAEVAAAEAAVSAGEAGAEERLSRAEARLEEALDGVLGAEFDFGNEATGLASGESSSSAEEEEEEAAMAFGQPQDEPRRHEAVVHDGATESAFDQACVVDRPAPGSFSKVSLSDSAEDIKANFPKFSAAKLLECEVQRGEMLYLPAGWFHEVTSHGAALAGDGVNSSPSGLHMAFNYWFHPPSSCGPDDFTRPYGESGFWERDWATRDQADVSETRGKRPKLFE